IEARSTWLRVLSRIFLIIRKLFYFWKVITLESVLIYLVFLYIIRYNNISFRPHGPLRSPHPKILEVGPKPHRIDAYDYSKSLKIGSYYSRMQISGYRLFKQDSNS